MDVKVQTQLATLLPEIHHYSSNEPLLSLAEPIQLATFNNDGL